MQHGARGQSGSRQKAGLAAPGDGRGNGINRRGNSPFPPGASVSLSVTGVVE